MNPEVVKFLKSEDFGRGTMIGDDPSILDLTPRQRAYVSAWRHACPQPDGVIKYYGEAWRDSQPDFDSIPQEIVTEHGIQMTRQRYDECDFVFRQIIGETAKVFNPALYLQLTDPTPRLQNELMGFHEPGRVPPSHESEMSPLSTLVGFALPRAFIELAGRGKNRTADRYIAAIDILEDHILHSQTPAELLAKLTESAVIRGVDPDTILCHVLEPGILKEENNVTEYLRVADALAAYAPFTWNHYLSMSPEHRDFSGIINVPTAK